MSQNYSQAVDSDWLSVPIAKFSYNSCAQGARSFPWNHVTARKELGPGNAINLLIQNAIFLAENGNLDTRILMKVFAGPRELESQDLGELGQHMLAFDPSSGGEMPVQVAIKPPSVAMRYPKSANIVRRIQFRFYNDSDLNKVADFVRQFGFPTETSGAPAGPSISRPSISPPPSLLSATSDSTSLTVPSIASTSSISASTSRISLPTLGLSSNAAELTAIKSNFRVPLRPNSSSSVTQRKVTTMPFAIPQVSRPATTSGFVSTSSLYSRLGGLGFPQNPTFRPTSKYISQIEREPQTRTPSLPILPTLKSSQQDSRPLFQSQLNSQDRPGADTTQPPKCHLSESRFLLPRKNSPEFSEPNTRDFEVSSQNGGRPSSLDPQRFAATLFESGESVKHFMPPKRELPFPKPQEVNKPRSPPISDLGPLPKPTPISRPSSANLLTAQNAPKPVPKPTNKRIAHRKAAVAKASEIVESPPQNSIGEVDAGNSQPMHHDELSPLAAKSAAAAAPRSTCPPSGLQSKAILPKKRATTARTVSAAKRPKMVDQATQTQTLSGRDHTTAIQYFRDDQAITSVVTDPPPRPSPVSQDPPEGFLNTLDSFITKHKNRPPHQELWEQHRYAEADLEQRQMLLNNFICDNLENEEFLQLCGDMSVAWRRIGLGM